MSQERSKHNKSMKKKMKGSKIENESLLAQIFDGKIATGKKQWTPGEDVIELDENELADDDFEDDGLENAVPGVGVSKKKT